MIKWLKKILRILVTKDNDIDIREVSALMLISFLVCFYFSSTIYSFIYHKDFPLSQGWIISLQGFICVLLGIVSYENINKNEK